MSILERIDQALVELPPRAVTVAAVSRHAGISRTCLYESYPQIIERIHERRASARAAPPQTRLIEELRAELKDKKRLVQHLIALVDHYAVAYQESQAMLKQRDREMADLRRRLTTPPVVLRFKGRTSRH